MKTIAKRPAPVQFASLLALVAATALALSGTAKAQNAEEQFKMLCKACHTIGAGRLVGPDLEGVTERRDPDWLFKYIKKPSEMLASDPIAKQLFEEYNRVPMPDLPLTDAQVSAMIEYLATASGVGSSQALPEASPEQVALGRDLFRGKTRLANSGPSCVSCHDVTHDAIISGGVLARELTTVFTRLGGGSAVRAVLGSPPFPVMQRAYADRPLREDEVLALVAFLQAVNAEQANHMPRDTGIKLAGSGIVGAMILFGVYALFWRRRKRGSVNQEIYDRQVRSI